MFCFADIFLRKRNDCSPRCDTQQHVRPGAGIERQGHNYIGHNYIAQGQASKGKAEAIALVSCVLKPRRPSQ